MSELWKITKKTIKEAILVIINCLIVVSPYSRVDKLIDCALLIKAPKLVV